jgi:maleate isomerase
MDRKLDQKPQHARGCDVIAAMSENRLAIGIILPSSNRIVERTTCTILRNFPQIDACFARVPYDGHPEGGYNLRAFMQAAELLAQARPNIILWNATRGALLGFQPDEDLCAAIKERTGVRATTTALETIQWFRRRGHSKIAMVQQGSAADGDRVSQAFATRHITITARHDLKITENIEASFVSEDELAKSAEIISHSGSEAGLIWSTNLAGYRLHGQKLNGGNVPFYDSATIGIEAAIAYILP